MIFIGIKMIQIERDTKLLIFYAINNLKVLTM